MKHTSECCDNHRNYAHQFINECHKYFQIVHANEPNLKKECYRLRYEVFAEEHSFENPAEFTDRLERNEIDEMSDHFLLYYRPANDFVGTMRLIWGNNEGDAPIFPIFGTCESPLHHDAMLRTISVEVSRLCIAKRLKKYLADPAISPDASDPVVRKMLMKYASICLLRTANCVPIERGRTTLLAVMEPFLIRSLASLAVRFKPYHAPVFHHGWRTPCILPSLTETMAAMKNEHYSLWQYFTDHGRYDRLMEQNDSQPGVKAVVERYQRMRPIFSDEPLKIRGLEQLQPAVVRMPSAEHIISAGQ